MSEVLLVFVWFIPTWATYRPLVSVSVVVSTFPPQEITCSLVFDVTQLMKFKLYYTIGIVDQYANSCFQYFFTTGGHAFAGARAGMQWGGHRCSYW